MTAPREFDARCEELAQSAAHGYYYPGAERDDVVQEARFGVWKAIRDWNPDRGSFDGFAWMCARRQVISGLKEAKRNKASVLTDSVPLDTPLGNTDWTLEDVVVSHHAFDPARIVIAREELAILLESARTLTPLERMAVKRCLIDGEPYAAVGDSKTVDNAIQRGREKLARPPLRLRTRKAAA